MLLFICLYPFSLRHNPIKPTTMSVFYFNIHSLVSLYFHIWMIVIIVLIFHILLFILFFWLKYVNSKVLVSLALNCAEPGWAASYELRFLTDLVRGLVFPLTPFWIPQSHGHCQASMLPSLVGRKLWCMCLLFACEYVIAWTFWFYNYTNVYPLHLCSPTHSTAMVT